MSRRYDSRTTTFSPDGRLFQVEYALESINHAGCVIGILAPGKSEAKEIAEAEEKKEVSNVVDGASTTAVAEEDVSMTEAPKPKEKEEGPPRRAGIVLAAEKRVTSKLLDKEAGGGREKLFTINDNTLAAVAGITADANSLVAFARNAAQSYLASYNTSMPIEQLVKRLCDLKQGYTQYGGLRPFGVSFLFAGYDPVHQFQLYATDPSGNYSGWKASCIGANSGTAQSLLRQDYKDDIDLDQALKLAVEVLSKTMDSTTLDNEKIELATISIDAESGLPLVHVLGPKEIDALLKQHGLAKAEEGTATTAAAT